MKTTVEFSDAFMNEVKQYAKAQGLTFRALIETALRDYMQKSSSKKFKYKRHSFKGDGLVEGLSWGDWSKIRDEIYSGRGS